MDPAKAMQAEAFYGHYHRFVTTTDIEFASAAITAMMVDEVPTFTKYYQVGERFVLQLNPVEEDWDPQEDDSLPVPKDYETVVGMMPPSATRREQIRVDLVPTIFSLEDIVAALEEAVPGATIQDYCECEIPSHCLEYVLGDTMHPGSHRNIVVSMDCDPLALGPVVSRGLNVKGIYYRAHPQHGCLDPMVLQDQLQVIQAVDKTSQSTQTTPEAPVTSPQATHATQTPTNQLTPPLTPRSTSEKRQRPSPHRQRPPPQQQQQQQHRLQSQSRVRVQASAPPIRQCYRCQQWHAPLPDGCKQPPKCRKCSGDHKVADCTSNFRHCAVCGGDHASSARGCPARPRPARQARPSGPASRGSPKRGAQVRDLLAVLIKILS